VFAKLVEIEGFQFVGFPGFDAQNLRHLSFGGRVSWLRYRFQLVFLQPLRALLTLDGPECYIWLCGMSLVASAVQALASLRFDGGDREKFTVFLETYLPQFRNAHFPLDDPMPQRDLARSAGEHFYKYFRNGLAHSFCIEWGGLQHREEVPDARESYLFQTTQGPHGEHGLGIMPREFVDDFIEATQRFFET